MATLTAGISSSATLIPLSAEVDNGYYTIDSEAIYVTGMSRGADGREFTRRWASVDRGVGGTTAASHLSGATLTRYYPEASSAAGGGGVTVDNQSDPPAEVTTIVAAGAAIEDGTATFLTFVEDPDVMEGFLATASGIALVGTGLIDEEDGGVTLTASGPQGQVFLHGTGLHATIRLQTEGDTGNIFANAYGDNARIALEGLGANTDVYLGAYGVNGSVHAWVDGRSDRQVMRFTTQDAEGVGFHVFSGDPSAGGGVPAIVGSILSNVANGTLWMKTGAGNTAWDQLAFVP